MTAQDPLRAGQPARWRPSQEQRLGGLRWEELLRNNKTEAAGGWVPQQEVGPRSQSFWGIPSHIPVSHSFREHHNASEKENTPVTVPKIYNFQIYPIISTPIKMLSVICYNLLYLLYVICYSIFAMLELSPFIFCEPCKIPSQTFSLKK